MNKTYITILIGFIGFLSHSMSAQQDFSVLKPINTKYKKMLKQAKSEDKLMLFISYNPEGQSNSIFLIEDESKLAGIDDMLLTEVLDWTEDSRHDFFKKYRIISNPYYLIINTDEILLADSKAINSTQDFLIFYGQAVSKEREYQKIKSQMEGPNGSVAQKEMIKFLMKTKDIKITEGFIDQWVNENYPFTNNDDFNFMLELAEECICSDRLYEAITIYESQIVAIAGEERYLNLRQAYILKDLSANDLLEPYIVWEVYDAELGIHADSMYRRFAIEYYQSVKPNQEILLDELYDYLYYYPLTPWVDQEKYFSKAIMLTKEKEDLYLLLDLIEYQIILDNTYRKQDYKALLLYKLGKTDRAISIMEKIEAAQPDYSSVLRQFVEN